MKNEEIISRIEKVLTSGYSEDNYIAFSQEVFDGLTLVSPGKFRKEYSNFSSHIVGHTAIGEYKAPDNKKIVILSVELKNKKYVENARSTQRNYAKKLIENSQSDAALIAFYTLGELKWRISFVRLDYEIKFENGKLKTSENITPARRYSFIVGVEEPCHTAIDRFRRFITENNFHPTLDEIEEAFSVEAVTNEFFSLYCEKFHQLREHLEKNQDFLIEAEQHNFTSSQFAKKLMGQIVFLYFLQKKGWLGVKAWPRIIDEKEYKKAFYARGAKSRELIPKIYIKGNNGLFHLSSSVLKKISDEDEALLASCVKGEPWGTGPHNFMRKLFEFAMQKKANFYDDYLEPLFYNALNVNRGEQGYDPLLHCRIPFLSGGLFEPIDGYEWEHNDFAIPNEIFSNRQSNNARTGNGILDIFDRYNFTMSEDEPLEREVAIDPEMLGKVFENLLEIEDRKSKGAFYTPREIVHYMCQESIINYLVDAMKLEEGVIRDFIIYGDIMKSEDTLKQKLSQKHEMLISEKLYKLDEHGNILVNRLTEMDRALTNIRVADPAVGSGAFPLGMLNEIVHARENISAYYAITMNTFKTLMMYKTNRSPYRLKYETIRNCIYAVDIEPSAVDITQLRLWLSLVIDDEITPNANDDLDGHRTPTPLPNLESNILCGNSLVDEFEGIKLINESTLIGTAKENSQVNINVNQVDNILKELIVKQNELFHCNNTENKKAIKKEIAVLREAIIGEQLSGCSNIMNERYNETKKMSSKPYILWQLDFARVFREKGGFDIVIGNPPYLKERDNKSVFSAVNNTRFGKKYHQGKMDYWYYFLHKSIDNISNHGSIIFITPRYWLNGVGATKLIERIKKELKIKLVVDIGNLKVFDNVVGYHMITQYLKNGKEEFLYKKLENSISDISKQHETNNMQMMVLLNNNVITQNNEICFEQNKEYKDCINLGEVLDVSQGVVEASDRVSKKMFAKYPREDTYVGKGIFVLTDEEVNKLDLNDRERKLLVHYGEGADISRYNISEPKNFLIYTDKTNKVLIEEDIEYIHLKEHLDNMREYITSSNSPYGLHRPRKKYFFESKKIVMPSMFAENNFAIDYTASIYYGMSLSCMVLKNKDFLIEYVLAILNSSVAREWFYSYGKKRGAGVDIGVDKIRTFPIKISSMEVQQEICNKVKRLTNKYDINLDNEIDEIIKKLYI